MGLGGKRLRPMLTLLAYNLYRENAAEITRYAIAVEAFHNFTLMHDDIMDKAPLRRGHQTVHEKWDVNTAILSGDVMLVKVYELFHSLDAAVFKTVIKSFNKCAAEVCEGQQWDMEFEQSDNVNEAQYIRMIRLKTAVLLGFSLELGGILADAPAEDRRLLYEFGVNIGIGFQLKDDLLDAFADPKKFGKQVGGDIIANKKTFLLIKALEVAPPITKRELKQWISASRFNRQKKVDAVKEIYQQLGIPSITEKKINSYFRRGFRSLEKTSGNYQAKATLKDFAEALMARQS